MDRVPACGDPQWVPTGGDQVLSVIGRGPGSKEKPKWKAKTKAEVKAKSKSKKPKQRQNQEQRQNKKTILWATHYKKPGLKESMMP